MEKTFFENGTEFREINVYIQAQDSQNPLFQCWLTIVQNVKCDTLHSISGKYYYGYGDDYGNPSGFIADIDSDYVLGFFNTMLFYRLQKPGDIIQGGCNSYAAAIVDFIIGATLSDSMIYDGDCTVMRVLK